MALSAAKKAKIEQDRRRSVLHERSLNGQGSWMDALHELYARKYMETGDESYLNMLPDYRVSRATKERYV